MHNQKSLDKSYTYLELKEWECVSLICNIAQSDTILIMLIVSHFSKLSFFSPFTFKTYILVCILLLPRLSNETFIQPWLWPIVLYQLSSINLKPAVMKSDQWGTVGTCVPNSYFLKCNWTVDVVMFPTSKSNASYKYTSKQVNYMIIRFMFGVLKYQLPPTDTTSDQL